MTPPAELTDILPLDWTPYNRDGWQWIAYSDGLHLYARQTVRRQWGLGANRLGEGDVTPLANYGGTVTDALEQLIRLVVEFRGRAGKLDRLAVLRLAMGARS
jgi:hypothetical protein